MSSTNQSPTAESATWSSIRHIWEQDADLAVCTTCGNQYSAEQGPQECVICNDDRQYVCPTGQAYTSQRALVAKTKFTLVPEESDARIIRIILDPPVAIGQTPILLVTKAGVVVWDCCGFASVELMQSICSASPTGKVTAILISHPHFFGTSLSWAKMLDCKLFISKLDRHWYQRGLHPSAHPDAAARQRYIVEVEEDFFSLPQLSSLTLIRCGGHFDGSNALHWDRDSEVPPPGQVRKGGAVFCSDTFMILLDQKRFTFAYSFPNNIPLPPRDVEHIWVQMSKFKWTATFGGWSGRHILSDSRSALLRSARYYIEKEGHSPDDFQALTQDAS